MSSSKQIVDDAIKSYNIMVFSKTTCGYCSRAKQAIKNLGLDFEVMELNTRSDGSAIQSALADMTGQATVPSIFVKGKHIGGCDSTLALISKGEFQKLAA